MKSPPYEDVFEVHDVGPLIKILLNQGIHPQGKCLNLYNFLRI